MSFGSVYSLYVTKAAKKGRTKSEVDEVLCWVTGYTKRELAAHIKKGTSFKDFFSLASKLNPNRVRITGVVCGVRVETVPEPLMREIRYLDKVVDELAKGWSLEKIFRTEKPRKS